VAEVLIVEDNLDLREMYEEILSFAGHEVRSVATATEAIAALDAQAPAVILLDLGIVGGAQAIVDVLRHREPGRTALLLASGARDIAEQAHAMGAAGWLQKPFRREKLMTAIATCISTPRAPL
jgi:two-component system, NtrC family, nitrogen regulation response regulator NtrX